MRCVVEHQIPAFGLRLVIFENAQEERLELLYPVHQLFLKHFHQLMCPLHLVAFKGRDGLVTLYLLLEELFGDLHQLSVRPLEAFGQSVLLNVLFEGVAAAIDEKLLVVSHEDGGKVVVQLREALLNEFYCAIQHFLVDSNVIVCLLITPLVLL